MTHEHDRFLYEGDGALNFGCVNPFCGHGDPALPRRHRIPLDNKDVTMKLLSHENGEMRVEVTPKDPQWQPAVMTCQDNLEECSNAFTRLQFEPSPNRWKQFRG